uniref:Aminotransferase-like plant mobile domain-containing protein n=1 Tax=Fagus sylvatica TaxID=28930 RepID=A0A2N9E722_FAGSY
MEVNKSLFDQCKRQLRTTPFGWLLNLHCNIEASGRMLEVMLATWNADERAFQVGDKLIPFTLYDVALILGLPMMGEPIDCNKSHAGGSLVETLLVTHLKTASPERTKLVTLFTKPSIKSPRQGAVRACNDVMGATGIRAIQLRHHLTNTSYSSKLKRTEREALARHIRHLEDELNHGKEQNQPPIQSQLPIQTLIVDLPSSLSKAVKRGKPAKKKAKAAMVDLASSPSKQDNEGEAAAAAAMVDLVSSPSKGATSVRYTRAKTRAQKNVMIVPPESEPVRNEWVDAHFLYQPTAHDEAVLTDLRKK